MVLGMVYLSLLVFLYVHSILKVQRGMPSTNDFFVRNWRAGTRCSCHIESEGSARRRSHLEKCEAKIEEKSKKFPDCSKNGEHSSPSSQKIFPSQLTTKKNNALLGSFPLSVK